MLGGCWTGCASNAGWALRRDRMVRSNTECFRESSILALGGLLKEHHVFPNKCATTRMASGRKLSHTYIHVLQSFVAPHDAAIEEECLPHVEEAGPSRRYQQCYSGRESPCTKPRRKRSCRLIFVVYSSRRSSQSVCHPGPITAMPCPWPRHSPKSTSNTRTESLRLRTRLCLRMALRRASIRAVSMAGVRI